MLFWCSYFTQFLPATYLSGVHRHFLFPRSTFSTSLYTSDIHPKAASFGGDTADFPEQIVGDGPLKRRSVAGVDQEELVDAEKLADHDSLFFEVNEVKIHHKTYHYNVKEEEGETFRGKIGFPVILLHGFGASVFSWGRIMKPLAHIVGAKVLAFDRPAFGLTSRISFIENLKNDGRDDRPLNPYSTAFSVLATLSFIDMLGTGKAILMGHSAGSLIAVNAYFESPERVAALILVAPAIFAPLIMKKELKFGAWKKKKEEDGGLDSGAVKDSSLRIWNGVCKLCVMIASILFGMLNGMKNMISSLFAKSVAAVLRSIFGVLLVRLVMDKFGILAVRKAWYDSTRVSDDVLQGYTKPLRAKGWEKALLEYTIAMLIDPASKSRTPLSKRLSEIKCPVLIVTGDTDRIVPAWNAQRLAQTIPGSAFEVISKCGHLPHEEKPQEFLAVIERFLCRTFGAQMENKKWQSEKQKF